LERSIGLWENIADSINKSYYSILLKGTGTGYFNGSLTAADAGRIAGIVFLKTPSTPGYSMRKSACLIVYLPLLLFAAPGNDTQGVVWDNRIAINAGLQGGNSSTLAIGGDLRINRNSRWKNEWTFTASGLYQVESDMVINQTAQSALRFAWSVTHRLYTFYRLALYHNKIIEIAQQVLPSAGGGYWFSDSGAVKLLIESGGGYNIIKYYDDSSIGDPVLQARLFLEYRLIDNCFIGNDSYYFPGRSMHQVKSSAYFTIKAKQIAAIFELIADYNSKPQPGLEPMDYHLKSGIEWSF
jgi:putative salt-induced outer membrane protein YdiY